MSKQVDERVVSMQFDNRQFEKNVQTTIGTLDKLKQSLNLKGASKGLEDVDAAAKKVNMSPLAESVEKVGLKFNALYSIADQALRNITNSAMNAGKKIVSALAIDPIKTGFQEYETQINSVQTILANTESKGSTLQDVNSALAELNTYADKTIYNFTEMTRNIGTFTAAGVDLKTSVAAIKGIANLAAVSGSTSQQASTAMYQLSQALSSGTVKLMDWNSVVNAGMGGQVFQDSLKETAKVHGIAIDGMIKKNGSFRETLKEGWLTSEILTETLSKFTGDLSEEQLKSMGYTDEQIKGIVKMGKTANDAATKVKTFTQLFDTLKEASQSGWTKSWELLIGDFGEAKELLTDISDLVGGVIGDSSDKRNEMLMGGLSTGWKQLLNEGIHDAAGFEEMVSNVAKEHGVDIASMIDDEHSFQDVLKQSLKDGTLTSDTLGESISKFTEKVGNMSAKELEAAGYTAEQIKKLKELDANVKNGTISMEEFTAKIIRPSGRELLIESLWNSIKGLQSVLTPIKQAFEEVFPAMTGEQLYGLIEGFRDFTAKLTLSGEQAEKVKSTFKGVFSILKVGINIVKSVISGCIKLLGAILPIGQGLLDVGGSLGNFLTGMGEAANKVISIDGIFGALAGVLHKVSTGIGNALSSLAGGIDKCGGAIGIMKKVADAIGSLFDKITVAMPGDSIFDTLFNLVNGGIFTTIGIWLAKTIKSLSNFTENAGGFLESITDILGGVGDALQAFTGSLKAESLKKIAISIGILAASLFVLSTIEPGKLTTALIGMAVLFKMLTGSLSSLGKILDGNKFKSLGKVTLSIMGIATSMLILSAALKILSTISWQEMLVGLSGMVVGLGALIGAVRLLPKKDVTKAAKALKTLSTSVVIFAVGLKILSSIPWQEMVVGIKGMAIGLGALVGAVNLLPKDTKVKAGSVLTLASAMLVLSAAIKILSSIPWQEMVVGIKGMAIGLGALVGAVNLLPKDTKVKAGSVLTLASAMVVLGAAIKILSSIPWQEMVVGIKGMAIGLGILVGALWLLPKDAAGKAFSILVLSSAMLIFGAAMKVLGSLSWDAIDKGLASILGVLILLGAAGYVLAPVAGVLLAIGGAVALLGVGCLAAGAGLVLLATGITALAAAIVGSVGIILAGANELVGVFTTIILSLVTALVVCVPEITNGLLLLLVSVLSGLVQYTPQLVNLLFDFVIGLLDGIAARLPELIQSGVNLLMSFFTGVVEALGSIDTTVLVQGLAAVGLFAGLIVALSAITPFIPGAMLAVLGMGALVVELGLVLAAIGALAQIPGLEWLIGEGGDFLQKIGTAIGQFLGGIVGGFAKGMSSALPQIGADLSAFMVNATPFIVGAKMIDSAMLESVKSLAEIILLLTGASILEGLTSWITGGSSFADFGKQLAEFGPYISDFAKSVSGINTEAVTAAANAGKMLAEMADVIPSDWGNNNLKNFGGQFKDFGDDIVAFSEAVTGKVSTEGIDKAASSAKTMVGIAESIPNDIGHNNLTNFGTQLENFGSSISTFSDSVNGKADGIASSTTAIKDLISYISSITTNEASTISTFSVALTNVGQNGVKGFIEAFTGSKDKAQQAAVALISTVSTKLENEKPTYYEKFKAVGAYLVDGFVKGIDENTYKAEAKAKAMAEAAEKAAKDELQVNSPSKKFMPIGSSVVEGFAKGVTENLGYATDSAKTLGSAMLEATQKELQINSPSLVFDKKVGRYVVQGVAEGIKKDMSAEEAAKQKAQNITNAFKEAMDRNDMYSNIGSNALELWKKTDGKYASDTEVDNKELSFYKDDLSRKLKNQTLAYNEWQETKKYMGETSDEALEAWNKYREAQLKVAEIQEEIHNIEDRIAQRDNEQRARAMEKRDIAREDWLKGEGKYASDEEIDARYLADSKANLSDLTRELADNEKDYAEAVKKYGKDSEEAHEAWKKVYDTRGKIADTKAEIEATEDRIDNYDNVQRSRNLEKRDVSRENWLKGEGKYASQSEIDARYLTDYKADLKDYEDELRDADKAYVEAVEKYGKDSEEAYNAWMDVEKYRGLIADTQENIDTVNERIDQYDNNERARAMHNREALRENWLKGAGRYASDEEIDARYLKDYKADLVNLEAEHADAIRKHTELVEKYPGDHEKIAAAWDRVVETENQILDKEAQIRDIEDNVWERRRDDLNDRVNFRNKEYELWEQTDGKYLDDQVKTAKKISVLRANLGDQNEDILVAEKQYADIVAEYGAESEEAKDAWDKVLDAKIAAANTQQEIADVTEEAAEKERESLLKQYELASDNADVLYQIWEKTDGRKATSIEKNATKITMLTKQIASQSSILQVAYDEWQTAARKYGEYSNEAVSAYNDYLKEQLELANLQNEITDINEQAVERQRLAQSEYRDYIEKYEKYYLKNGMSREDLERDARLISGYDPDSTVESMIDRTNKAIKNITDSQPYSNLLSGFNSMGNSYVTAVNEGVQQSELTLNSTITTLMDNCLKIIKDQSSAWTEAGACLMTCIIEGMESKKAAVVSMARTIATAAASAIEESFKKGSNNSSPVISPVVDLSNVKSGTTKIKDMFNSVGGSSSLSNVSGSILYIGDKSTANKIGAATSNSISDIISGAMSNLGKVDRTSTNDKSSGGNTYQFTQNNYSPKSLSTIDIYRNTQSQFSLLKGANK